MTFADLAFATWNEKADAVKGAKEMKQFENFPRLKAWHERVTSRPAWKVILEKRAKAVEKLSFQLDG
jgi:glutathione S-transferase